MTPRETLQAARPSVPRVVDLVAHLRTPLYRHGYLLILSTVLTSGLGLGYWTLAARLYRTEDVGLNSAAISVMIFLAGLAQLNIQEAMIRYIPLTGKRTVRFVVYSYLVVLGLSACVGLIFCLGLSIWSPRLNFITASPASTLWFIVSIMLWGIFVVEDAVLTGLRQTKWVPLENAVFSVAKILLLVALAILIPATGIFISWSIAVLLVVIPINFLLFRRLLPQHVRSAPETQTPISIRKLAAYVAGNYAAALLVNVSTVLLPVIITQLVGAVANAHFYVTWIIASSLQIITSNMATSLTVEGATSQEQFNRYRWRVIVNILRLLTPLVVVMIVAAPLLLQLLGDSYAAEGVWLLRLLALASLPNVINIVYIAVARVTQRIRHIIFVYGANALMVLVLSYLYLRGLGITGVGLAWLISQTLIASVVLVQNKFSTSSTITDT